MPGARDVRRPDASVRERFVPYGWRWLTWLLSGLWLCGIANAQTHSDADSTSLVHARRLLRDAQQWAEFGNVEAARALAERAADMGVQWPAGELTPQAVLDQWAGKPAAAPAEPAPEPAEEPAEGEPAAAVAVRATSEQEIVV